MVLNFSSREDNTFCAFCLPPRMDPEASRATGMILQVVDDHLALMRAGERLPIVPLEEALRNFFTFLRSASKEGRRLVVLIAHNGHRFDFLVLLSNLRRSRLAEDLLSSTKDWLLLAGFFAFVQAAACRRPNLQRRLQVNHFGERPAARF